jgi:hypothetical protein
VRFIEITRTILTSPGCYLFQLRRSVSRLVPRNNQIPAYAYVEHIIRFACLWNIIYDTKRTGEPAVQRSDANAAATPIYCPVASRVVQEPGRGGRAGRAAIKETVGIGDFHESVLSALWQTIRLMNPRFVVSSPFGEM